MPEEVPPAAFLHVLIPVFGRPGYLRELLTTIEQHLLAPDGASAGDEVLVTIVDDASLGSGIEELVSGFPGVEYVRNPVNLGIGGNFNRCVELSRGRYTVLVGSDDAFMPGYVDALQRIRAAVGDVEVLAPGVRVIDGSGRPSRPMADRVKHLIAPRASNPSAPHLIRGDDGVARLLVGNYLYFPALAWRTETLRGLRFDPAFEIALDFDLLTRMLDAGGCIAFVDSPAVFSYRRHASSASQAAMLGANVRYDEEREVHRKAVEMARLRGWRHSVVVGRLQPTSRLNYLLMKMPRTRSGASTAAAQPEDNQAAAPLRTDTPGYTRRLSVAQRASLKTLVGAHLPYRAHITSLRLGRTLDVGCGTGRNLRWLAPGSVGVDSNATSVAFARARGLPAMGPEEFLRGPGAAESGFDSLLLSHLLEHLSVPDIDELLEAYLPHLRPGGRLVVITPQERGQASDPSHVTWLDASAVSSILVRHGLRIERTYSFPLPRPAGRAFAHNESVVIATTQSRP